MQIGRIGFSLVFVLCLGLVSVSSWIILNPTKALAATCVANCGATTVVCGGYDCWATDNQGCWYKEHNAQSPLKHKACPQSGGGGIEPELPENP